MRVFTDSDEDGSLDRQPDRTYYKSTVIPPGSPPDDTEPSRRTPRRVRFGGEVVKMRTPDSDALQSSDQDDSYHNRKQNDDVQVVETVSDNGIKGRNNVTGAGKEDKPVRNSAHSRCVLKK